MKERGGAGRGREEPRCVQRRRMTGDERMKRGEHGGTSGDPRGEGWILIFKSWLSDDLILLLLFHNKLKRHIEASM